MLSVYSRRHKDTQVRHTETAETITSVQQRSRTRLVFAASNDGCEMQSGNQSKTHSLKLLTQGPRRQSDAIGQSK